MSSNEAEADTFVAFVDISGFKSYLDRGEGRTVLNDFYNTGAKILHEYHRSGMSHGAKIKGILISDCAILYISEQGGIDVEQWPHQLVSMLYLIHQYNVTMLEHNHLLTCSIACGPCDYEPRIDDQYIRKNSLLGQGYVRAFTDNEYGLPKIRGGQCRIVTEGLPDYPEHFAWIFEDYHDDDPEEAFLSSYNNIIKSNDGNHLHYYWMLDDDTKIDELNLEIKNENEKMYEGIKRVLKKYVSNQKNTF